jgi:hypothetical protein
VTRFARWILLATTKGAKLGAMEVPEEGGVLTMRVEEEEGEEEMRAGRAAEVAGWRRWSWGGITP